MREPEEAQPASILPDILAPGLDVIFVGAAPSLNSARVGHYYAGPSNRFWLLLHQAGFTPRRLQTEEDHEVLNYGIGLTGIFRDRSTSANHLLPEPSDDRRAALLAKLLHYAPRFVCYNGKDVYRMCTAAPDCEWGLQPDMLGISEQFVVHSSSGRADRWGADRLDLYRSLRSLVKS